MEGALLAHDVPLFLCQRTTCSSSPSLLCLLCIDSQSAHSSGQGLTWCRTASHSGPPTQPTSTEWHWLHFLAYSSTILPADLRLTSLSTELIGFSCHYLQLVDEHDARFGRFFFLEAFLTTKAAQWNVSSLQAPPSIRSRTKQSS